MSALHLRPAEPGDARWVHVWANDPETRAASFSTGEIALDDHLEWFARQLAAMGQHLLIAEDAAKQRVAFVRLDARGHDDGGSTISINVDPSQRGQGTGTAVLEVASRYATGLGLKKIEALVRPDNHASVRAFEKAGYARAGETKVEEQPALRLVKQLE